MPKRFSRWWLMACTFATVNAHPTGREQTVSIYGPASNTDHRSSASANDYDFDDSSDERFVENINEASGDDARVSTTTVSNNYIGLPLILEADAEMLPAHYTGVKPPGVDHMEITFLDSASLGSHRNNNLVYGTKSKDRQKSGDKAFTSDRKASSGAMDENGFDRTMKLDKAVRGKSGKENETGVYVERVDKKEARQGVEKHSKGREEDVIGASHQSFGTNRHRGRGQNAAGYHNAYHKDESKKDANFYDSDHEGGRYHKHGRYQQKHTASEGDYRKDAESKSEFVQAEAENFKVGPQAQDAKGRAAKPGYHSFFGKVDELAEKTATGVGQSATKKPLQYIVHHKLLEMPVGRK